MATTEPTWSLVLEAAQQLGAGGRSFTRDQLVRTVQSLDQSRADGSIGPVIQGMTANAPGGPASACGTPLVRVGRGVYRLAADTLPHDPPAPRNIEPTSFAAQVSDVVLVGCVKSKRSEPAPAQDLYTSALFRGRRRYAETHAARWFVLSSRWGLVAPDEIVAPYDLYLGDQSDEYRSAWGGFVVQQLRSAVGSVDGWRIELHAGAAYREALLPHLARLGATVESPLSRLTQGEQLAWYGRMETAPTVVATPDAPNVDDLLTELCDPSGRRRPSELLAGDRATLQRPGLYTWWVDEDGARNLSAGGGVHVPPGLIYAGLAGATRWPSGRASTSTLWTRLSEMHLGRRAEFSTFRRTLAALLREPLSLATEDDARLSAWMEEHLTVAPVAVDDADSLGRVEQSVLQRLDPPLNLQGMTSTPLRQRIRELRAGR